MTSSVENKVKDVEEAEDGEGRGRKKGYNPKVFGQPKPKPDLILSEGLIVGTIDLRLRLIKLE